MNNVQSEYAQERPTYVPRNTQPISNVQAQPARPVQQAQAPTPKVKEQSIKIPEFFKK